MGTICVRVLGDCATVTDSNHEEAGEMYREIRKMFRDGASRMIPFDTVELAASLRELSDQLGDLSGGLRAVAGYELQKVQVGLEISTNGGFNLIGIAKDGGKDAD